MPADSPLVASLSFSRRVLIMASVVLGSTLYSTTLLIAAAMLPQMQGSMGATADEIAWSTTFNILATAIVTPMAGFLIANFGRRRVMLYSVGGFTIATFLCGYAASLEALIFWRITQGGIGAPLIPLSNAMVLDCFPRRQAGLVSSIFGMTVVVLGPVELAPGESARFTGSYVVTSGSNPAFDIIEASGMDTCLGRTVIARANCAGPIGPAAEPIMRTVSVLNGVATVTWDSVPGETYTLQCKGNHEDPIWINIPGNVTATGTTVTKTDQVGPSPKRFYRAIIAE